MKELKKDHAGRRWYSHKYLKTLHEKHEKWMEDEKLRVPVMVVDVTEDFNNKEKMEEIIVRMKTELLT